METAHNIDTVVLDKTGTITQGTPVVTNMLCKEGIHSTELLQIAASLEKLSEHPLADAIVTEAEKEGASQESLYFISCFCIKRALNCLSCFIFYYIIKGNKITFIRVGFL